jgi:hypothetical protein
MRCTPRQVFGRDRIGLSQIKSNLLTVN